MVSIVTLGLRALELLWTLLIMALVGNMIHDSAGGDPAIVNYTMFVAVFSMLSLIYLFAAELFDIVLIPMLPMLVDALNVLFFFVGAVALAAYLGAHSCNNSGYTKSNLVTKTSGSEPKRCREAQASTAFLWFAFACYAASMVLSFMNKSGGGGLRGGVGGIRRGGPSMSQV
ncbi:MAG: hypothetical protein MMC23_003188 [Stictis urceolatum]|nr:hypothetical protein [Stictis urceolata]